MIQIEKNKLNYFYEVLATVKHVFYIILVLPEAFQAFFDRFSAAFKLDEHHPKKAVRLKTNLEDNCIEFYTEDSEAIYKAGV